MPTERGTRSSVERTNCTSNEDAKTVTIAMIGCSPKRSCEEMKPRRRRLQ